MRKDEQKRDSGSNKNRPTNLLDYDRKVLVMFCITSKPVGLLEKRTVHKKKK